MRSENPPNLTRAFRVATFHDVTDDATFTRGPFRLEVWVDRHDHAGYTVRYYHDSIDIQASGEFGDRRGVSQLTLSPEFVADDGLRHGFDMAHRKLRELEPTP
jgi:hypothetical protein